MRSDGFWAAGLNKLDKKAQAIGPGFAGRFVEQQFGKRPPIDPQQQQPEQRLEQQRVSGGCVPQF